MVDGASVARIRDIVATHGGTQAAMLTAFGLMCAGTADFSLIIRDAVELLRRILPSSTIGYFWSAPDGEMVDAYVDTPAMLSQETWQAHQRYIAEDPRNWPTFNENVLAGPVAGYLLPYQTPAFYKSQMFAISYESIGARHIMDAVAHDGEKPLGAYLFMHSPEQGPFSTEEVELARTIAALTTLAFGERSPALMDSTRLSSAGMLLMDETGKVFSHDIEAHQSLWMLERGGKIPVVGGPEVGVEALAMRYCAGLVEEVRGGRPVLRHVTCRWGDFEIRCEARDRVTAIRFMQYRPFAYHIAMKLLAWELPARRLTVCWLALMGLTRKEIAAIVGIAPDTVGEHIDALFRQVGVNSTMELLLRVAA